MPYLGSSFYYEEMGECKDGLVMTYHGITFYHGEKTPEHYAWAELNLADGNIYFFDKTNPAPAQFWRC